jgi:hypothetical protein
LKIFIFDIFDNAKRVKQTKYPWKIIVVRMVSRLDARKIEPNRLSPHKQPMMPPDKPLYYILQVEVVHLQDSG